MALYKMTNRGVSIPRSNPMNPLLALYGKTTKSWTIVGPKLKIMPLYQKRFCRSGRRNSAPQIPPQIRRGYNQAADICGAIFTPNADVIPSSPKNHTAKLFNNPPKQPAAKTKLTFFAKFFTKTNPQIRLRDKKNEWPITTQHYLQK